MEIRLVVGTGNISGVAATHVNFMITGDKEAINGLI